MTPTRSVTATPNQPPAHQTVALRGAIAFLVIGLLEALVGFLVPAANGIYGLVTGSTAPLLPVPWWVYVIIALAPGVLLVLTHDPSRQYVPRMHGKFLLLNVPFAILGLALIWFPAIVIATRHSTRSETTPYWVAAVISLVVAIAAAVIDYRQGGVIPFYIGGFRLVLGRKNRKNRVRTEHQAAAAYASVPDSERLPVLNRAGRWAVAPVVTLLITVALAIVGVVSPIYVPLAIVGGVLTALFVLVILFNLYARKTGIYIDLSSYFRAFQYLSNQDIQTYHLRMYGLKVALVSGFVELAVYVICVGSWLAAVILWAPILAR